MVAGEKALAAFPEIFLYRERFLGDDVVLHRESTEKIQMNSS